MPSVPRKHLGIVAVARPTNGGSFQYTLETIEALRGLPDVNITLYCPADVAQYAALGLRSRPLDDSKKSALYAALLAFIGINLDLFPGEDVIVAPMFSAKLLHARSAFVYTLHDIQERHFPQYFSRVQRLWRRYIHGRLTRRAAGILCESQIVKRDIINFYKTPEGKIRVIAAPPLKGKPASAVAPSITRKKYGLAERFLFYPAQFWAHKNHARLLEAFSRIAPLYPDIQLVLTGHRRFCYEVVMAQIRDLSLQDRVIHVGYVDDEDVAAIYRLATALVMPSLFESISIPVYEAFQAGTPVCASNAQGMAEQIGEAGLTFDPFSVDAIEKSMLSILQSDDLRSQLVARGHAKLGSLTTSHYTSQLNDMLHSILNPSD